MEPIERSARGSPAGQSTEPGISGLMRAVETGASALAEPHAIAEPSAIVRADLPAAVRSRLERYRERFPDELTPDVLQMWERWAGEAAAAVRAARAQAKRTFSEPEVLRERSRIAAKHLDGEGIEIGALHNPLPVPERAHVRYVDRCDEELLAIFYPEVAGYAFVAVDVVDDGEALALFADASQDFVISNHFLEHCQDPLGALIAHARVLRPGGTLYCSVPDCRKTFDAGRERTSFDHLLRDHRDGPAASRRGHYRDWSARVNGKTGLEHEAWWRLLDALDYSIHFHVWTPADVLELWSEQRRRLGLALELVEFLVHGNECISVLRKD